MNVLSNFFIKYENFKQLSVCFEALLLPFLRSNTNHSEESLDEQLFCY